MVIKYGAEQRYYQRPMRIRSVKTKIRTGINLSIFMVIVKGGFEGEKISVSHPYAVFKIYSFWSSSHLSIFLSPSNFSLILM
jgi:hypothetical protein